MRALDQASSIKDLNIERRFCNLRNFNEGCNNDDDDDDDNNIGQSPGGNLPRSQYRYHRPKETNRHFRLNR